jgi:hypothetical protein
MAYWFENISAGFCVGGIARIKALLFEETKEHNSR